MASVSHAGAAAKAGIAPGDLLLSLDGRPIMDIIDYQFLLEPGRQEVDVDRGGRRLKLIIEHGAGDPGIVFQSAIFDRVRTCSCDCIFCFVDQLPQGLRPSLYVRDDDFRLSFLDGNFITLNNLSKADLRRIAEQRLSPLHVSVHTTDAAVRARMMGVRKENAARGLKNLRRLGEEGIEFHAQVVLCPGINDGGILEHTVAQLARDYPGMASVGVVPVSVDPAYIRKHLDRGLRAVTAADARGVIAAVSAMQRGFRNERGRGFVYAADEFYLQAGEQLPRADEYDGYPQYENGIGIAASFLADLEALRQQLPAGIDAAATVYLLTGELASGVVGDACTRLGEGSPAAFRPLVAANQLFGLHVTVTGLLGGGDVIRAAEAASLGRHDMLLIPSSCLDGRYLDGKESRRFLDGVILEEVHEALPCRVVTAAN